MTELDFEEDNEHYVTVYEAVFPFLLNKDEQYQFTIPDETYRIFYDQGPFKGAEIIGMLEEDMISIQFQTIEAVNYFYKIFPTAPLVDYDKIRKDIDSIRFIYAYIVGENYLKDNQFSTNPFHDVSWNNGELCFSICNKMVNNKKKTFIISANYQINIKTKEIEVNYFYYFRDPKMMNVKRYSFSTINDLLNEIFKCELIGVLDKSLAEFKLNDYKILPMVKY